MEHSTLGYDIRQLLHGCDRASLAVTLSPEQDTGNSPYVALVLAAFDFDASPLFFISDLAEHTKALRHTPTCSVLFDGTTGRRDPLTGARVSLQGTAEFLSKNDAENAKSRYISRHPSAAIYAGFNDFNMVRFKPTRAHLVAGFGKIHWLDWSDIGLTDINFSPLAETEFDVIAHMNDDHSDVINLIAGKLLHLKGLGWQLVAINSEGCDLRLEGKLARYTFQEPVLSAQDARKAFILAATIARKL